MAKDNEIKLGDIAVFHSKKERGPSSPDFEGKMKTERGEYYIKLWKETKETVTNGEYLKGYIYSVKKL